MKKILKNSLPAVLVCFLLVWVSCNQKNKQPEHKDDRQYTCSMHPQIIKNAPGTCPICGMELVPLHAHDQHSKTNDSLGDILKPTDELVLSDIETVGPQRGSRITGQQVKGVINYNTNNVNAVSARVGGRIERLYVTYNFEAVSRGQKLMDIYSPELLNAQQELIFLKENNEPELLEAARRKLSLLGVADQQISRILRSGKPEYTLSIYSPYSGYITEIPNGIPSGGGSSSASQPSSSSMGDNMGGSVQSGSAPAVPVSGTPSPVLLREGQYVSRGEKLFSIVDPSKVWAEFYVTPGQLKSFRKAAPVEITSVNDSTKTARASISLIQPFYSEGATFSLIRATLPNSGNRWKTGELINVTTASRKLSGNWLPRSAVLQLGSRYISFVKRDRAFVTVYVTVKSRAGNWVDISGSLDSSAEVAVNAWFMVDSESFVKVKKMEQ